MLEITTTHYLILSAILFTIGIAGIVSRRNMITVLMSIELMLNSVNLNFIAFSYQLSDLGGQIFSIFTIAVAAGEAAVGLGILVAMFRLQQSVELDRSTELSG
ncbi:MAG: NADH-quinone oxidoreductase subunit NuoK [Thermoanaerobaculia bacterium]